MISQDSKNSWRLLMLTNLGSFDKHALTQMCILPVVMRVLSKHIHRTLRKSTELSIDALLDMATPISFDSVKRWLNKFIFTSSNAPVFLMYKKRDRSLGASGSVHQIKLI